MNDKFHEELSALMDGEISDLELRRLLKQGSDDPQILATWQRLHSVRSVLRGEHREPGMRLMKLDLSQRVAAALASEETHHLSESPQTKAPSRWRESIIKPFASVAVAASVSALVVIGWQGLNNVPGLSPSAGQSLVQVAPQTSGAGVALTQTPGVAPGAMPVAQFQSAARPSMRSGAFQQADIIRISDQEYDERLRRYLISHSGNAAQHTASGTYSYARAVSLKPANAQ